MSFYTKQLSILYVEEKHEDKVDYEKLLSRQCAYVKRAINGKQALALYKQQHFDVVITDIDLPVKNGVELAKNILKINSDQIIIFVTTHTEFKYTLAALEMQVCAYLIKPLNKKVLLKKLDFFAKQIMLEKENLGYQNILKHVLNKCIIVVLKNDFKTIKFQSDLFLPSLYCKDIKQFSKKYPLFVNLFKVDKNYLFAMDKDSFLRAYELASAEERVVLIDGELGEQKSFLIEINKFNELYIISLTDISQLHQGKLESEYKATHDALTDCYNRSSFDERLKKELQQFKLFSHSFSLVIIDIDHFSKVNNTHGHQVGDRILIELVKLIKGFVRQTDFFARWGGEEFILIMPNATVTQAQKSIERLRQKIEAFQLTDLPQITISAGIAQVKKDESKERLFNRVDSALYRAKNAGRNKVAVNV